MTGSNREDCFGLDPQSRRRRGQPRYGWRRTVDEAALITHKNIVRNQAVDRQSCTLEMLCGMTG